MFIDFPEYDFQFAYNESMNKDDLIEWLTSNEVTGPNISISRMIESTYDGRLFTVRSNFLCYVSYSRIANYPVEDLPLVSILKPQDNKILLLNILDSILKEIGYYRRGKYDPILNSLRDKINAATEVELINRRFLLNLVRFSSYFTTLRENFNISKFKAALFYKTIFSLMLKTYSNFKVDINFGVSTTPCDLFHISLSNKDWSFFSISDCSRFNRIISNNPKYTINKIKKYLKPVIINNPELTDQLFSGLS